MNNQLQKKAYFQCRRGLQELDVMLIPFVKQHFKKLTRSDQHSFMALLSSEDVDLLDWLVNQVVPPKEFSEIIRIVIKKHFNK